jgi:hypothetical protein
MFHIPAFNSSPGDVIFMFKMITIAAFTLPYLSLSCEDFCTKFVSPENISNLSPRIYV